MEASWYQALTALREGAALAFVLPIVAPLPVLAVLAGLSGRKRIIGLAMFFLASFMIFSLGLYSVLDIPAEGIRVVGSAVVLWWGIMLWRIHYFDTLRDDDMYLRCVLVLAMTWALFAGSFLHDAYITSVQSKVHVPPLLTLLIFLTGWCSAMLLITLYLQTVVERLKEEVMPMRRMVSVFLIVLGMMGAMIPTSVSEAKGLVSAIEKPYSAPEIQGITQWFNSEPLTMEQLKGKVVLVNFWTYSCINCVRTLPYINEWYAKYKDQGFVVVGLHAPEFSFEKSESNVEKAIAKMGITHPVAMDNSFTTWRNYNNRYWPAYYLVNKQGNVVYTHFGEKKYDVIESNIRYLLAQE